MGFVWMQSRLRGRLCLFGVVCLLLAAAGCAGIGRDRALSCPADQVVYRGFSGPPRMRLGSYPSATIGTPFLGPSLGTHGYDFRLSEKNGIAYTCRGGHIDIIHVRIAADWTAYLAARTYRHLMDHDRTFSYKLAVDRSQSFVTFSYPPTWEHLSRLQQMAIAREVALAVGAYLTYTMTTWHEMLTWYGFKCMGVFPEFPSAFSWEDSYSNLLGTRVAVQALQDARHRYDAAVTLALDREMRTLGVQTAAVARRASESVRGLWFTGNLLFLVNMKERNFDIGLDDGFVTPTLIPAVSSCPQAAPVSYPVPTLEVLARHGFSMTLEIAPREWEGPRILHVVYGDKPGQRIRPQEHFARIMTDIRRQAEALYGPAHRPEPGLGLTQPQAGSYLGTPQN